MSTYRIEPARLLDAAERLAPPQVAPGRPPYTAHRRAVSTAYYAVFHAISARVAEQAFPSADALFRQRVRRWIGHDDIKTVARWITQMRAGGGAQLPPHIRDLLAARQIGTGTAAIASGFLELNDKREQADYDHEAVFSRAETLRLIALARRLVGRIEATQSDDAKRFFGLIAMQAKVRGRG